MIPAQTCDELSCGQGKVYGRTDGRTDRWTGGQMKAMTIPFWPERPRGKNEHELNIMISQHYTLNLSGAAGNVITPIFSSCELTW